VIKFLLATTSIFNCQLLKGAMEYIATAALLLTYYTGSTDGFAYAPNFITKIIKDETNIEPVGLLVPSENGATQLSKETVQATQKVTTRFPPEPNGYLHLGHAKAVSFNFAVARMFGGDCHMRLDDTNPSKEDEEYVTSILEDVQWIQSGLGEPGKKPWSGSVRKTSDYFEQIYECAVSLIKSGDAFVDSLSADEMREYRGTLTEPGKDSPYRTRSVEKNLELFEGMRKGKFTEGTHILRAKIDMASPNINMRDPTLFRIKHESHQATGDTWCIYPMYDFSHPISDSLEGISYSLCTLEFEDHRPFYDWTVNKLKDNGMLECKPQQIEFSRLNVKNTVLSKRKLIQLVHQNHVSGWDDPRMPTLSGIRRRGVPPAALRLFCERVGISKADSNIDYVVLEDCIREEMDKVCVRAFCVLDPLKITLTNWGESAIEDLEIARHPKMEELGNRVVPFGKHLFIERSDFFDLEGPEGSKTEGTVPKDFKRLLLGGMVRLKFAYVISCDEIFRDPETQEPVELKCTVYPETRNGVTPDGMQKIKGIIHWVEASTGIKCQVNQYDRLFLTEEPGKDSDDFINDINPDSFKAIKNVIVEPSVAIDSLATMAEIRHAAEGEKIYASSLAYQFERSGYFALDQDSTGIDNLIFNRVVTLRDAWGTSQQHVRTEEQRNRGGGQVQKDLSDNETLEDIRRVALKAATILNAGPHPEADNLLICKVDCGDVTTTGEAAEPRTVVAGLAGKIPASELIGKKVVVITNLKPAKMRGVDSMAMLLAASGGKEGDEKVELLSLPDSVPNGELVSFEGIGTAKPDDMLKSKGALRVWDRVKASLKSNAIGEATYLQGDTSHRMMTSGGPVTTATLTNAPIQ